MNVEVRQNTSSSNLTLVVNMLEHSINEFTYEAVTQVSKEIAQKIAGEIFKKHKKKIIAAVDVDLIVAEVQKLVLERVKKQAQETKP